ncbi:Scr1 family TA system antitoxin-like transcriptional regulator [Streptomyces yaizuensis]|uniref:Scr1 family TA system antitoxin-like transcriptional regulator n=1 Tax=Streptomyces yaizuensis TaxID=2989713 RepID=A0ABQ5P4T1_9ACTN|nr:Scr1 family TA system antitoxin-like transcriptional regulator [Streptomyces sp. YSPA8]
MSDFQNARESLGARLRELRTEAGLAGKELAESLGWQRSKVSRLENGRQTATTDDLQAWAQATGVPLAAADLVRQLSAMETHYRSWKRVLAAGHRAVQDTHAVQERGARVVHLFECGIVPGIFQTPEYARAVLSDVSDQHGSPADVEDGVRARMRRQEALYERSYQVHALMWEAALYVVRCPDLADTVAQLDRLTVLAGLDTVNLGIIPLGVRMPVAPKHGFWIMDGCLVVADTWNAELSLDSADDIALYRGTWETLQKHAVFGHGANRLIARARARLSNPEHL